MGASNGKNQKIGISFLCLDKGGTAKSRMEFSYINAERGRKVTEEL